MPAERHPEPPRLPSSPPNLPFRGSIDDGEELGPGVIASATCVDAHLAAGALHRGGASRRRLHGLGARRRCGSATRCSRTRSSRIRRSEVASLTRVLVDGGRLTGLQIAETEMRDCAWQGCGADMASFRHAKLERATFQDCSLREADFMGLRGDWVRFHDCDLRGASFVHAQFTSSELLRCRMDDIEGVEGLRGTSMELEQMLTLAPALARALGVSLLDE